MSLALPKFVRSVSLTQLPYAGKFLRRPSSGNLSEVAEDVVSHLTRRHSGSELKDVASVASTYSTFTKLNAQATPKIVKAHQFEMNHQVSLKLGATQPITAGVVKNTMALGADAATVLSDAAYYGAEALSNVVFAVAGVAFVGKAICEGVSEDDEDDVFSPCDKENTTTATRARTHVATSPIETIGIHTIAAAATTSASSGVKHHPQQELHPAKQPLIALDDMYYGIAELFDETSLTQGATHPHGNNDASVTIGEVQYGTTELLSLGSAL